MEKGEGRKDTYISRHPKNVITALKIVSSAPDLSLLCEK